MSSGTHDSIDFAREFAARLAPAFDSPIAIATMDRSTGVLFAEVVYESEGIANSSPSLRSELDRFPLPSHLFENDFSLIPTDLDRSILAIDASENRDRSIGLFVFANELPSGLVRTLVEAIRLQVESLSSDCLAESNNVPKPQDDYTDSFIEQITQDFEELTWLRQSHRYADLYSVKASPVDLAHTCVASMTPVIHAESLLFLEVHGLNVQAMVAPSQIHLLSGPVIELTAWQLDRWIERLREAGRTSPILLDRSSDEEWLLDFPSIRNCMITVVSKGERVYGWLIAVNKIPPSEEVRGDGNVYEELNRRRFGTFEAGLLTTAANMLASQASNSELFAAQEELTKGLVLAIINAIDAKDCYTAGHSERVASFGYAIASRMRLPEKECDRIHMAGLLHDVGKIGIPDSILKKPDKLTDEEFQFIKAHPVIGYTILKHLNSIDYVLPGVLYHHEAFNGSGYPQGLQGENIPLMARILAVSDAFDAMTSTRAYRKALSLEQATGILRKESSVTWDPDIVRILFDCIQEGIIAPGQVASSPGMNRNAISELLTRVDTFPVSESFSPIGAGGCL